MKFLYFLAAIGGPDLEKKFKILARNLIYIHHNLKQDFSIAINCYNTSDEVSEFIKQFSFLDKVYFHSRPNSVLTELWFTNPYMKEFNDYDEILVILDDVSISRVNIPFLLDIREKYNIDIISPAIINATHKYMIAESPTTLALTNHLEVYCMFMKPSNFRTYLSINTVRNKWIWGVDLLFGHYGINTAVYYGMNAFHAIPAAHGRKKEAFMLMNQYLNDRGFKSVDHVVKMYPTIRKTITI